MRILITAIDLSRRGGIQLFVRDLAIQLLQMGHDPIVHSPALGPVANDILRWAIPVTSDLRTVSVPPNVIIGNHHLSTMNALMRFPECAAVLVCHGFETPIVPKFGRIRRHVAVDEPSRDLLVSVHGIDPHRIERILSSVDVARFRARAFLPVQPRRALLFGNQFMPGPQLNAIRAACARHGMEVEVVGRGGRVESEPEKVLHEYDLIFARGRCAIEAMATGAAVVLTGPTRIGPLVTSQNIEALRPMNFGRKTLLTPITLDEVLERIAGYDPVDAAEVSRLVRETASLESAAVEMLRIVEDVEEEQRLSERDGAGEYRALAEYLARLESDFAAHAHLRARLYGLNRFVTRVSSWPLVGGVIAALARRVKRSVPG